MGDDEFWDFAGWDFFNSSFDEDEKGGIECPACEELIRKSDKVVVVDQAKGIILCPHCNAKLRVGKDSVERID